MRRSAEIPVLGVVWAMFAFVSALGHAGASTTQIFPLAVPFEVSNALESAVNIPLLELPDLPEGARKAIVEREEQRLTEVARGLGYLDAIVQVADVGVPRTDRKGSVSTSPIRLNVTLGPAYRIGSIELRNLGIGNLDPSIQESFSELLTASVGAFARAEILSSLEDEILWRLHNHSFPYARTSERQILPDRASGAVQVQLAFETGPSARFGPTTFVGLGRIEAESLVRYLTFKPGDEYQLSKIQKLQLDLTNHPDIERVSVEIAAVPDFLRQVPIEVKIREKVGESEDLPGARLGAALLGLTLAWIGFRQVTMAGGLRRIPADRAITSVLLIASGLCALQRILAMIPAL